MTDILRTMIVTAGNADLARSVAASLSARGDDMFTTSLSASGSNPATHYVSTGYIAPEFAECITSGALLHQAAQAGGSSASLAQCDVLVATSDVSDEEPFTAFSRLGLSLVSEE